MNGIKILVVIICSILGQSGFSQIELGDVKWLRDRSDALLKSRELNKPVLILFQEVPGCMTCQRFGSEILSDPLLVEAIETLFVPLCIYNNKSGADAKVLELYNEASWNNPVLRITDYSGHTIQRLSGAYGKRAVLSFFIDTYAEIGRAPPFYLELMHEELMALELGMKTLVIETPCFWSGEVAMGEIRGIMRSEAGWMSGREVVRIYYNPLIVDELAIVQQAKRAGVLTAVYSEGKNFPGDISVKPLNSFRRDSDTKYYLQHSNLESEDLLEVQKLKLNSLIGQGNAHLVDEMVSPRQRRSMSK